jgi:hypothetical protein
LLLFLCHYSVLGCHMISSYTCVLCYCGDGFRRISLLGEESVSSPYESPSLTYVYLVPSYSINLSKSRKKSKAKRRHLTEVRASFPSLLVAETRVFQCCSELAPFPSAQSRIRARKGIKEKCGNVGLPSMMLHVSHLFFFC